MDDGPIENMNISIPGALARFVEQRVAGRFGNRSEYIRHLIREDQVRAGEERLHALMMKGLESGHAEITDADWEALRERAKGTRRRSA